MESRIARLRKEHGIPSERTSNKVADHINSDSQKFIENSPFAVLSSSDADGNCDASPRGGKPGFIKVIDERKLFIPDVRGNRLFHSFGNFESNPKAGLIFFIPGSNKTLRVNGRVSILEKEDLSSNSETELYYYDDTSQLIQGFYLHVDEAYSHCPRALLFSDLWNVEQIKAARS